MTITHDEREAYPLQYDQFAFHLAWPNEHYQRWRRERENSSEEHPTFFDE
jgi:hypothetical protein